MSGLLDAAIAVHPRAWRERYGAEVRSTLLDVADEGDGRVPVSETLPLVLRGLWMRARGSLVFWGGLLIVVVMVVSTGAQAQGFRTDPAWISYSLHLNAGLAYAFPLVALLSGWVGARSRAARIVGVRRRLVRFWRDCAPILASVALGYAVALIIVMVHSGWPFLTTPNLLLVGAQVALTLAAVALGYALGAVLPRVLVIFVAPAAVGIPILLLFAWSNPWLVDSVTGYTGLASVPVVGTFLYVIVVGATLAAVSVLVVAIRPIWARVLPMLAIAGVAAAVAVSGSPALVGPAFTVRDQSELICTEQPPVVCLWPEQDAAFGDELRADMAHAYARAVQLGLPVDDQGPTDAARFAAPGTASGYVTGLRPEQAVNFYASTFIWDYVEMPEKGDGDSMAVMFSIAILLGVPRDQAWPAVADPSGSGPFFDASEIPDEAAAEALVERWLSEGVDGLRAP